MRKLPDPNQIMAELLERPGSTGREREILAELGAAEVIRILDPALTQERKERIQHVVSGRTRSVTTVVEGVLNTGNASAVMRTAEVLGFQDLHVVTNDQPFKHSARTSTGAEKWLDVHVWRRPEACAAFLRHRGYRIVVTHLDDRATPLEEIDFSRRTALVFGNELNGASPDMLACADDTCLLPVSGFVQSYNISVAAAIALYHAHRDRVARLGANGDLTDDEGLELQAAFYLRATAHAEDIIARSRLDNKKESPAG